MLMNLTKKNVQKVILNHTLSFNAYDETVGISEYN